MKKIVCCLVMFFTLSTYGQEKTNLEYNKFQIGINISPNIAYRNLKENSLYPNSYISKEYLNEDEYLKYSFNSGLNVCYNFNKHIGLEIGGQYANKGYQIKNISLANIDGDVLSDNVNIKYNFNYIDVPVKLNLILGDKRVRFFSSIGVVTNFLIDVRQKATIHYSDHVEVNKNPLKNGYKKVNISPIISCGIDCKIGSRSNLRIEPTFSYGILKVRDTPVKEYLFNGGLNVGYYIGL